MVCLSLRLFTFPSVVSPYPGTPIPIWLFPWWKGCASGPVGNCTPLFYSSFPAQSAVCPRSLNSTKAVGYCGVRGWLYSCKSHCSLEWNIWILFWASGNVLELCWVLLCVFSLALMVCLWTQYSFCRVWSLALMACLWLELVFFFFSSYFF